MLLGRFRRRKAQRTSRNAALLPLAVFALFAACVVLPHVVNAQTTSGGVNLGLQFASSTGLTTTDIRTIVGNILKAFFGLLGIVAVLLILYAGFLWMTAAGNEEKVHTAKQILINATIGLIIMLSAFAITQFIFGAVTGAGGPASSGSSSALGPQLFLSGGSGALGSGIIDYHYPEAGQTGVPRNTKIAITFKKPLALSTFINGYDDKNTPVTGDDAPAMEGQLNTDNIKIIANTDLQPAAGATPDARFDARYVKAIVNPAPNARVTVVAKPESDEQTVVITFANPIGSPTADVNYRVALRGGAIRTDNAQTPQNEALLGLQVWSPKPDGSGYQKTPAFTSMDADGGYFWTFTTNTTIDVTPPKITAVVPVARINPSDCDTHSESCVFRNQLLQVYFDEAVDPTLASGIIGAGGGFNNIDIQAECRDHSHPCDFGRVCSNNAQKTCVSDGECGNGTCLPTPASSYTSFSSVGGTMTLGNRYRTAEFLPSALCEGVSENSCGEPVYCLPKNVELKAIVRAPNVGSNPPQASDATGVEDMVGNSLDGNGNGKADGPAASDAQEYSLNRHPDPAGLKDTAVADYYVGEDIDLVPPKITQVDPPSREGAAQADPYNVNQPQAGGPSKVPTDLPPKMTWSKIMSIGSVRTGMKEDPNATVILDAWEWQMTKCDDVKLTCTSKRLDPPAFFVFSDLAPSNDPDHSIMTMDHHSRPFFTANDLGYNEQEAGVGGFYQQGVPKYVPSVRNRIKDSTQNCFYPSAYEPVGGACTGIGEGDKNSCCNKTAQNNFSCAP